VVDEPVRLDLTEAFNQIKDLTTAITVAAKMGAEDAAALLERELGDVKASVSVDLADPQELTALISNAVEASREEVSVGLADPDSITNLIVGAVDEADTDIDVDVANLDDITSSIEGAVGAADTGAAASAAEDTNALADSLGKVKDAAPAAGASLGHVGSVATIYSGLASAATGSTSGLANVLNGMGPVGAVASAALGATVGVLGAAATQAAEAEAANRRLTQTLGEYRDVVETINVGTLNKDLSELALQLGSDDDAIRASIANFAVLAKSSGATREEIANTSEQLIALAANAVALDPSLGSVADVVDQLPAAMARGGRALARYNIDVSDADLASEALAQGITKPIDEMTLFEKTALRTSAAAKQIGDDIGDNIAKGSDLAIVKLRSLKQSVSEALESAGGGILDTFVQGAEAAAPALSALVGAIGQIGVAVGAALGPAAIQVLHILANSFKSIGDVVGALTPLLALLGVVAGEILKVFALLTDQIALLVEWLSERLTQAFTFLARQAVRALDPLVSAINSMIDAFNRIPFVGNIPKIDTSALDGLKDDLNGVKDAADGAAGSVTAADEAFVGVEQIPTWQARAADLQALDDAAIALNATLLQNRGIVDEAFFAIQDLGDKAPQVIFDLVDAFERGSLSQKEFKDKADELGISVEALTAIEKRARSEADGFGKKVAEAVGTVEDATKDLSDKGKAHISDFVNDLQTKAFQAAAFANSIQTLIERGATSTAQHLLEAGQDAAGAAAEAAIASDQNLATIEQTNRDVDTAFAGAQTAITQHTDDIVSGLSDAQKAYDTKVKELVAHDQAARGEVTGGIARDLRAAQIDAYLEAVAVGKSISDGIAQGIRDNSEVGLAIEATIDGAMLTAQSAIQSGSPSRLFALEVGIPISEGIAQGILDARDAPQSAIEKVIDMMTKDVQGQISDLFDAISAGREAIDAQRDLREAEQHVTDLTNEQIGLKRQIAVARKEVDDAIAQGAVITAREQQNIERAIRNLADIREQLDFQTTTGPQQLDQAKRELALQAQALDEIHGKIAEAKAGVALGTVDKETQQDLEKQAQEQERNVQDLQRTVDDLTRKLEDQKVTTNDLLVAEEDLGKAQQDAVAPAENLADAQRKLNDLLERQTEIGPELEQATRDVEDAQLHLVQAFYDAAEAGEAFYQNGHYATDILNDIATQAGLAYGTLDALIGKYAEFTHGVAGQLGGAGGGTTPFPGSVDLGFTTQSGARYVTPQDALAIMNFFRGQGGQGGATYGDFAAQYGTNAANVAFHIYQAPDPAATASAIGARLGLAAVR